MAHPFAQEITYGLPKLVNIILWPIHISSGYPPAMAVHQFMCIPYNGPRYSSMFKVFQSESLVKFFSAKCLTVLPKC